MGKETKNQFIPDYAIPPGETLADTLGAIGMSQADLAKRMGRPVKTVNEIIKGKAAITAETALQLERVLGIPSSFWNNLERNFRETLARIAEQQKLQKNNDWLTRFPIKHLAEMGLVKKPSNKTTQLENLLNFFGVASPKQWEAVWMSPKISLRTSAAFKNNPYAISAWLRIGQISAQNIECKSFDAKEFENSVLPTIRSLTVNLPGDFSKKVADICSKAGVAVVFVPEFTGVKTSGATWWANPNKAVIQLSLRYKRDDQLWFSFFHEAAHILLHGKKEIFIDAYDGDSKKEEEQANRFAADFLIPPENYENFIRLDNFSKLEIIGFANRLGISPGIVVGRLQRDDLLDYRFCNDLKRKIVWA